jgi:hypothetical protein
LLRQLIELHAQIIESSADTAPDFTAVRKLFEYVAFLFRPLPPLLYPLTQVSGLSLLAAQQEQKTSSLARL